MRIVDLEARTIEYRLNLLGIRVWEHRCQLIAKGDGHWNALGPQRQLPIHSPSNIPELIEAADDPLRLTAYQYVLERPCSDLREVLNQTKDFKAALERPCSEWDE